MKDASRILSDLEDARIEAVFLLEWSDSLQKEADDLRLQLTELKQRVEDLEHENLNLKIELEESRNQLHELRIQTYVPVERDLDTENQDEDSGYLPLSRHYRGGWFTRIFF